MELVRPALEHLRDYAAALERGWSADNTRGLEGTREEMAQIKSDGERFVSLLTDWRAAGPVTLPDGSKVPRLPSYRMWMWDGEFCGSIGLRWQPGTVELPPHVLGHIGYTVVPWKQRRGYATKALALMLPRARAEGLPHVDLTADADNSASQKVITANGGVFVERFLKPPSQGGAESLRFRIALL